MNSERGGHSRQEVKVLVDKTEWLVRCVIWEDTGVILGQRSLTKVLNDRVGDGCSRVSRTSKEPGFYMKGVQQR